MAQCRRSPVSPCCSSAQCADGGLSSTGGLASTGASRTRGPNHTTQHCRQRPLHGPHTAPCPAPPALPPVDADTVFLRDPIPLLLRAAEEADADVVVATATAPCGSAAQAWDAEALDGSSSSSSSSSSSGSRGEGEADSSERHQSRRVLASAEDGEEEGGSEPRVDAGEGVRYATGLVLYRSTPAALRCAYSLLLDMASLASRGHSVGRGSPNSSDGSSSSEEEAVVWEQERFAAFMPTCMGALGRGLAALPTSAVLTTCGADAPSASELAKGSGGSGGVVAVHISSAPPGGGGEAGAVEASLAARVAVMKKVLGIEREEEGGKEERR